jgi:hypothetical protein
MADKIEGFLEVGCNEQGDIVINIPPNRKKREQHKTNCAYRGDTEELCNCGIEYEHIVFSPHQARNLAQLLLDHATSAEREIFRKKEELRISSIPPGSAQILTDGSPVPENRSHTTLRPDGQQEGYVVLSPSERSKGFVRPYRDTYRHLKCGKITTMSQSIAETYARDPYFYSGTFCATCRSHFPIGEDGEFVWYEMNGTIGPKVGT